MTFPDLLTTDWLTLRPDPASLLVIKMPLEHWTEENVLRLYAELRRASPIGQAWRNVHLPVMFLPAEMDVQQVTAEEMAALGWVRKESDGSAPAPQ